MPLRKREPVSPVPYVVERVAGALDHALVAGQPEVVVRAEHDPLGALHLDDRQRPALERAEVGQRVELARGRSSSARSWSRALAKTSIEVGM